MGFPPVAESGGSSLVAVRGLLTLGAPLVAEHRLSGMQASAIVASGLWSREAGFSCSVACGVEPMSPTLAGEFFTTEPQGKPRRFLFMLLSVLQTRLPW